MVERIVVGTLHTNSYIFFTSKKECVVIDPGAEAEVIEKRLSVLNLVPRLIILTHGHLDHASAATDLLVHYRSHGVEILIAIHEKDKTFLGRRAERKHRSSIETFGTDRDAIFDNYFHGMPDPDLLLTEDEIVPTTDLKVIHTPGHTPGSICLYSEAKKILFSGDTLFFEGVGRSDLPGGSQTTLIKNIREKIFSLPPETRVFPGHGPQTTIERELFHNPFTR